MIVYIYIFLYFISVNQEKNWGSWHFSCLQWCNLILFDGWCNIPKNVFWFPYSVNSSITTNVMDVYETSCLYPSVIPVEFLLSVLRHIFSDFLLHQRSASISLIYFLNKEIQKKDRAYFFRIIYGLLKVLLSFMSDIILW